MAGFIFQAEAQVQYNGCSVTGTYASAIGKNNTASGNNSFAGGYGSQTTGSNSFAFGYNSKATQSTTSAIGNTAIASGTGSMALGNYVKATAQNAFVFGSGTTASYPLTNSTDNSIAFGINSNKPTMLITKSLNNNYTGKVAIGQVTSPQAKLHLKSDNNEDAGVFIETSNTNSYKAFIKLFDNNHSITVDKTATMELNSGTGALNFKGNNYCFGSNNERKARIYTSGTPSLYINASRSNTGERRDSDGTSFAIDFDNSGMIFRSATFQSPRGSEITNWKKVLFLSNDGKIGINTVNTVNDYALAVNGGIITTKVFIKEVKLWPDYVFADNYSLMGLDELKQYLNENHHLPGIPDEKEIVANGYDLNEMQTLMMEKIEEMTRYILLLQDEIDALKSKTTPSGDSVVFSYDRNGNRIARSLTFKRIVPHEAMDQTPQTVSCDLYPNPTPGTFTVVLKSQDKARPAHATLLTTNGVVLEEKNIEGNQASFDLSRQTQGIYLLEIDGPDGHQTWKVIKH